MRLVFVLVGACVPLLSLAQSSGKNILYEEAPAWAIKWSPLHLFNYYPTFQVAVERRIFPKVSLQLDGGLIMTNWGNGLFDDGATDKQGYKVKVEPRYYGYLSKSKRMMVYGAPELYYNHVDYKKSATYGKDCDEWNGCSFFQQETFRMEYRERGITLKFGILHRFPNGLCIDYHIGISSRFIRYKQVDIPEGVLSEDIESWLDFSPNESSRNTYRLATGFRIGYILK